MGQPTKHSDSLDLDAPRKPGDLCPLSEYLATVDSTGGRHRVTDYLKTRPLPHYEAAPGQPGFLIRITEDGRRALGRFVNRRFVTGNGTY